MKVIYVSLTCFLLYACYSTDVINWPRELPERDYFVSAYRTDPVNREFQTREAYLQWIVSFYQGTLVAPTGWSQIQLLVVGSAPPSLKDELEEQLFLLGRQIAAEWAKDNSSRLIDSRMLGIWGAVLQLAEGPSQQYAGIQLIRKDVNELLLGKLLPSEVNDARYEENLGLQLFGDI